MHLAEVDLDDGCDDAAFGGDAAEIRPLQLGAPSIDTTFESSYRVYTTSEAQESASIVPLESFVATKQTPLDAMNTVNPSPLILNHQLI